MTWRSGAARRDLDQRAGGALLKAAEAAQYKGRKKATVEVLAPPRLGGVNRVVLLGTGKTGDLSENDWVLLGGSAGGAIGARKTKTASLIAEAADSGGTKPEAIAAMLAFGASLRHYEFRKYLTKRPSRGRATATSPTACRSSSCIAPIPTRRAPPSLATQPSPTASSPRATSSTSRPTRWGRSSSPIASRSWRARASRSRSSMPTRSPN